MGPVEYMIVEFPGNQFKGEIVPALQDLVSSRTIRIIDLLFVKKDADGNVSIVEIDSVSPEEAVAFSTFDGDLYDLLNEQDIALVAEKMQPNSSGAVMVFEHLWAIPLRDAVVNAGGRLVDDDRVPEVVAEAAMQAALAA
jgi:hypothetical protein